MTEFVFSPPAVSSLAIEGSEARFPVRRIFCVGRNYAAHSREMGKDPSREPPFFFTKPADAAVDNGAAIPYPPETNDFHYEIELIVAIGQDGSNVPVEAARDLIWGYGVGIDLTRRDLQLQARDKGRPWDWGKAFDLSAPIAPLHPVTEVGHPQGGRIWLAVNDTVRQDADIAEMIWDVPEIVSKLSQSVVLRKGDIVMTGTPAGIGAIVPGDRVTGGIDGLGEIVITIVEGAERAA